MKGRFTTNGGALSQWRGPLGKCVKLLPLKSTGVRATVTTGPGLNQSPHWNFSLPVSDVATVTVTVRAP